MRASSIQSKPPGTRVAIAILMRLKLLIFTLGCLLLTTACAERSPLAPTVPLNRQFTLAPGESASVEGTTLELKFIGVSGDSRCPADAFCIQGGDAIVHVRAANRRVSGEYELHTGDEARATVRHANFRITLSQLQPYPFSSRVIDPDEYRATLTVTR